MRVPFLSKEIRLDASDSEGTTTTSVLAFLVLPENDPPVLASTESVFDSSTRTHDGLSDVVIAVDTLNVKEDIDSLVPGLSVRDVDLDISKRRPFGGDFGSVDGHIVEMSVYASNGTVSLGAGTAGHIFLVGDGVDDKILVFRTSLARANVALAGLTYRGLYDFYGTDELLITIDDLGNFGRGSLCSDAVLNDGWLHSDFSLCPQVRQKSDVFEAGQICRHQMHCLLNVQMFTLCQ